LLNGSTHLATSVDLSLSHHPEALYGPQPSAKDHPMPSTLMKAETMRWRKFLQKRRRSNDA
jgi:hypothetical protein